jgi:hypothetical protein
LSYAESDVLASLFPEDIRQALLPLLAPVVLNSEPLNQ